MGIDTPTQPPVFGSAHDEQKAMDSAAQPTGIFSMEEFMKQHQEKHQAQREAMYATPTAQKAKTNENTSPPVPVAVGARSSKYTIMLHEKYQGLGIPPPLFTYEGGSSSGWTVSVSFPGLDNAEELQGLRESRRFNSKQEAKEALSEKALAVLEELEKQGRVKKAGKARKKSEDGTQVEQSPEENYVGRLLEFQRSVSGPQPTYTDYQSGTRFACLLTLDDHSQPFGSLTSLFTSKKAARQDAARHAVEHFQSLNLWPQDTSAVGGIRKKKKSGASPTNEEGAFPLPTPVSSSSSGSSNGTSFAQQVASLALTLALPTPEWRFTSHPSDPTFHTVACFFRNAGPHEGPIGEVRNVFGKKKAKEECARLTLEYLLDVREKRRAYGARMMQGVIGGEGVVSGAEGRRVEGEGDKSDDDEEMFEDAVEVQGR